MKRQQKRIHIVPTSANLILQFFTSHNRSSYLCTPPCKILQGVVRAPDTSKLELEPPRDPSAFRLPAEGTSADLFPSLYLSAEHISRNIYFERTLGVFKISRVKHAKLHLGPVSPDLRAQYFHIPSHTTINACSKRF
jgi:hypothetical protein